jgi:predicted N-acetyltransferase YhbS
MEIRNPGMNEVEDIVARVSVAFGYKEGQGDVARDFPQLYGQGNERHLWAAYVARKLAGHAGFYPAVMKVEHLPLPVAGIGGVFVEEAHRSLGLGSKLVQKCCEEAHKEGAALAFLWSDKHEYYGKLGFHLVGRQWTIALDPKHASPLRVQGEKHGIPSEKVKIVEGELSPDFLSQSYRLQERFPVGIARSPEEHALLLASGACRVFSAWVGKDLAAYFVIGKGMDLGNYVHEWAGEEGGLHHLAAGALETLGHPLNILSPQFMPEEVRWVYTLEEMGFAMRGEQMALVKMLDFPKVRKLLAAYMTRLGLPATDLKIDRQDGSYYVEWRGKNRMHFDEGKFLKFLFGPELPINPEMRAFLPLRLWYWGMDSV